MELISIQSLTWRWMNGTLWYATEFPLLKNALHAKISAIGRRLSMQRLHAMHQ